MKNFFLKMGSFKATMSCSTPKWMRDSPTPSEKHRRRKSSEEAAENRLRQQWFSNTFPLTLEEYCETLEQDIIKLKADHSEELGKCRSGYWDLFHENHRLRHQVSKCEKDHEDYVKKAARQKVTLARRINKLLTTE